MRGLVITRRYIPTRWLQQGLEPIRAAWEVNYKSRSQRGSRAQAAGQLERMTLIDRRRAGVFEEKKKDKGVGRRKAEVDVTLQRRNNDLNKEIYVDFCSNKFLSD